MGHSHHCDGIRATEKHRKPYKTKGKHEIRKHGKRTFRENPYKTNGKSIILIKSKGQGKFNKAKNVVKPMEN